MVINMFGYTYVEPWLIIKKEEKKMLSVKICKPSVEIIEEKVAGCPTRWFMKLEFDNVDCNGNLIRVTVPRVDLNVLFTNADYYRGANRENVEITFHVPGKDGIIYKYELISKKMTMAEIEEKLGHKVELVPNGFKGKRVWCDELANKTPEAVLPDGMLEKAYKEVAEKMGKKIELQITKIFEEGGQL